MNANHKSKADIIVAGHICLDIILPINNHPGDFSNLLEPSKVVILNGAHLGAGGCTGNTGMALCQLGIPTRIISKIGSDAFSELLLGVLRRAGESLIEGIILDEKEATSYTIVLTLPGMNSSYLNLPGGNDHFRASDVSGKQLVGARYFHFGYPPELSQMRIADGLEAEKLLKFVKARGLTTSMDMTPPDPASYAGSMDWRKWLRNVLPQVDIFLPSWSEIFFMLDRPAYEKVSANGEVPVDQELLDRFSRDLIEMGAAMVVLKLGAKGLFLRTTNDPNRLDAMGLGKPQIWQEWLDLHLSVPAFEVEVANTTGAGDCSIAGFLTGFSKGLQPLKVLTMSVAVAGFSVESADGSSGVPHWEEVEARVQSGWTVLQ